jgi:hypothetical protein
MSQYPVYDVLVLDAMVGRIDDNPQRTTAAAANLDIDGTNAFQALGLDIMARPEERRIPTD